MPTDRIARKIAAKKAAKTRRANREGWRYYHDFTKPANERIEKLLNYFIRENDVVELNWCGDRRLKGGALVGQLVAVRNRMFLVLPFGYARPQWFHPKFWEPVA